MEIGHNEDATMYTNEFENNNSSNKINALNNFPLWLFLAKSWTVEV